MVGSGALSVKMLLGEMENCLSGRTPMSSAWIESIFLEIIWYNLKKPRKVLQKIFDAINFWP